MKSIFIPLLFFLFVQPSFISLNAQEEELVPNFLCLFGQIGVSSQTTITHTLTVQGAYWDGVYEYSTNSEWEVAEVAIPGSTTEEPSYEGSTAWKGYYFGWGTAPYQYTDFIAYSLYKVTNSYNNDYFYIDLRDCKYAGGTGGPCGYYNPDFFIRFDEEEDIFQWRNPSMGPNNWITISTGEILNVWDIRNNGTPPATSAFEDYWDNALLMTNNGSNRPRIVWGPYPDSFVLFYLIYRDESGFGNFTHIANVNNSTFSFTDNSVVISEPGQVIYYKVKAFGKEFTNTVSTTVIPYKKGTGLGKVLTYSLSQNYPNPFNPNTAIYYSVKDAGLVSLKVFDILGSEVAVLVNSTKEPGNYEVSFDAINLPSGVYIYTLKVNGFTDSKKMLLLR